MWKGEKYYDNVHKETEKKCGVEEIAFTGTNELDASLK